MSIEFRPAKRENVPLLLGVAGGTGSGKTMSALRIARGIAGGKTFVGIDTENGRMSHYADRFPELRIGELRAPFRPDAYAEAIRQAVHDLEEQGVPITNRVVVVDSASHEWAGDGGCLDWKDEITKGDNKKSPVAWATVKRSHKKMVTQLLQVEAHIILCLRAEPKVDIIRENGELKFVPKQSITGLDGWLPITEKMLPYELTASFLLMADAPGFARPIKLEEQHKPFVPLEKPLDEEVGKRLAAWARGGAASRAVPPPELPQTPSSEPPAEQPAFVAPVAPMTGEEFRAAREREGISPQAAGAKGRELFPGRARLGDLSDEERGQLWKALVEKQESLA